MQNSVSYSMKIVLLFLSLAMGASARAYSQAAVPRWQTLPVAPPMPVADTSGWVSVNGIRMYYAVFNKEGKEPVFLLHGGFVSSDCWGFEVPLLAKTHQVIVVDNRGHGRSTLSDQPFSYDLMTSDVLNVMDSLQIPRASVVGWSDGGIIGLMIAMYHPERIDKLFAFGANYNQSGYKDTPSDTSTARAFMSGAEASYRRLSATPGNFGALKKALGKMYGVAPDLAPAAIKKIKTPTAIVFGEHEQFIKREHFEELAKLIPNARLVMLKNVSHGAPLQDPEKFHEAVAAFLATN